MEASCVYATEYPRTPPQEHEKNESSNFDLKFCLYEDLDENSSW